MTHDHERSQEDIVHDLQAARERMGRSEDPLEGEPSSIIDLRPTIPIDRDYTEVLDASVEAIQRRNQPRASLFIRGGRLAQAITEGGQTMAVALGSSATLDRLADAARFVTGKSEKTTEPRSTLPGAVAARIIRTNALPVLDGIVETPLMLPSGEIVTEPGYHPEARVWYAPSAGFELDPIPEHPTQGDIERARNALYEIYVDFPFADTESNADRATALALPATLVVRHLIDGPTPAFAFDGTVRGAGKGLAADVGVIVTTGRPANVTAIPDARGDEEWRKQITSIHRMGSAYAFFDNVTKPIRSGSLAAALTSTTYDDRLLGTGDRVRGQARAAWIFTGNNITLRGDLPRRFVWCRLEPTETHPAGRTGFKHAHLRRWVLAERPRLLAALFTLVRAWIQAGRPGPKVAPEESKKPEAFGSYEAWYEVIGGIFGVAGIEGLLANPERSDEADVESAEWSAFLWNLSTRLGDSSFLAGEVAATIRCTPALREVIPGGGEESWEGFDGRKLGSLLGSVKGRMFETMTETGSHTVLKVDVDGKASGKRIRWVIRRIR